MEGVIPLPGGNCHVVEHFLNKTLADQYFDQLQREVNWHQPEITLFGRKVQSPRLSAWYGEPDAVYTYSGLTNKPLPWTSCLLRLKKSVETACNTQFNSVLLNLYRNGQDSMGWHSDDETELGREPVIASLSLGETRRFSLKHKRDKSLTSIPLPLNHGSLLVMSGATQHNWRHCVPKTSKPVATRINLTFRYIVSGR